MKLSNEMREFIEAARVLREVDSNGYCDDTVQYDYAAVDAIEKLVDALNKWEQLP